MERLEYDLLFRWFVGLGVDDPVWDHSTLAERPQPRLLRDLGAEAVGKDQAFPGWQ